uniref:Uncharacterized protein n=1 Tax=Haplochromis burtoni TaxID=8153 RepID=A0A3Q2WJ53_HAPBU
MHDSCPACHVKAWHIIRWQKVSRLMSPWERTEEAGLGEFLHVCLSVSPDMLWGRDDNRDVRGVQRPRSQVLLHCFPSRPSSGHS